MSNEITLVGPDNSEIYAHFEDNAPDCIKLYTWKRSIPDIPGIVWIEGRNPLFRYSTNPIADFIKVCDNGGYQVCGEEKDWLDNRSDTN